MEASNILHMASGDGESSYANNSLVQCFKIADLGCSSGPNTLLSATNIIDIVHEECKQNNRKAPQFQVSLVDLVGNDFNTVFELLPNFYAKLKEDKGKDFGPCFVSAVPGSFYDRLFPDESLHLVYSSYSVHWLSQVPEGLENNTSNIFFSKTSPPNVFEAYQKQYASDFTKLLQVRSKEVVSGGRMVLTLIGQSFSDPTIDDCVVAWELLTLSLLD
ncbi:benzoate carboxyl methyltransferase-like protein, partial [Tanacetum coccineum]